MGMDDWDTLAAVAATFLIVAFITVSRRMDAAEAQRGKAGWKINLAFWLMIGGAFCGAVLGIDHPFWGDVLANVSGGFAALAVAFLADHLRRFLRGERPRK